MNYEDVCRSCLILLWVASLASPVLGQVNTEAMRAFEVEGFASTFSGDVALESGNSELFEVGLGTRFDYRQTPHYAFLIGRVRYGEEGGSTFKNRSFAHLRYNRQIAPWLVAETFTQVQQDAFRLLRLRVLAGSGARIRYVDTGVVGFFQGTTLMYEREILDAEKVTHHPAQMSVGRWSNYLNVQIRLTDNTSLVNTVYIQPRLDAFGDVRVLDEAALAVKITDHLTLSTSFSLHYDSRPPQTVESLDLALRNGIEVSF